MTGESGGPAEAIVNWMIRRTVNARFHNVYWRAPLQPVPEPAIFVPNHHGWHDGYLMYLALSRLNLLGIHDWIQEYDAFPLFGAVGGMPFPTDDPARRSETIRRTVRLLRARHSLLLFAEGVLHRPPGLLEFGKSLDFLARVAPEACVIPVAIRYELALHERPEAFVWFGEPMAKGEDIARRTRLSVAAALDRLSASMAVGGEGLEVLHSGTKDVNERWDFRKMPRRSKLSGGPRPTNSRNQRQG